VTSSTLRTLLVVFLATFAIASVAQPAERVALLIGNGAYPDAPLRNPVNDVRALAEVLRPLGFVVTIRENQGRTAMRDALRTFVLGARDARVRLFHFAGHGLQLRGRSYLLPVDARIESETDIVERTVDVTELADQLGAIATGANVLVIDACRTHPLFTSGARRMWAARPGLAEARPPQGSLVAYSTRPGQVARDGAAATSVYTRHLVQAIRDDADLPVEMLFKRVRDDVAAATRNAQVPWDSSDIVGDLCLRPGTDGACRRVR